MPIATLSGNLEMNPYYSAAASNIIGNQHNRRGFLISIRNGIQFFNLYEAQELPHAIQLISSEKNELYFP